MFPMFRVVAKHFAIVYIKYIVTYISIYVLEGL